MKSNPFVPLCFGGDTIKRAKSRTSCYRKEKHTQEDDHLHYIQDHLIQAHGIDLSPNSEHVALHVDFYEVNLLWRHKWATIWRAMWL